MYNADAQCILERTKGAKWQRKLSFFFLFLFFFFFLLFRAIPVTYESSQARGQIQATVPRHSHSNAGSEPHLRPTPQFMAMPDPRPAEQGQGLNLHP